MVITCQKCGQNYHINPRLVENEKQILKCKVCNAIILLKGVKNQSASPREIPDQKIQSNNNVKTEKSKVQKVSQLFSTDIKSIGMTSKFMIYILAPLFIIYILSTYISVNQMAQTHALTINESLDMGTQMSEKAIIQHARAVAMQIRLFLQSNPSLQKENFNKDVDFKRIAVQKVGLTGSSALYELPDEAGTFRILANQDPKMIGESGQLEKYMEKNFQGFRNIIQGTKNGLESQGYFAWYDKDGTQRKKFMVCTPVEGTRFMVSSTAYLDEFIMPVTRLDLRMKKIGHDMRIMNVAITGIGLLIIALIILIYGRSLTRKIAHLSLIADRISVGDLDVEIKITSKDEIGELANAIIRMQDSIRIAMERLTHRKK